jgi:hypothetical protein
MSIDKGNGFLISELLGMDAMLGCELHQRFFFFQYFPYDLGFEACAMLFFIPLFYPNSKFFLAPKFPGPL